MIWFSNTDFLTCRMQSEGIVGQHFWLCVELKISETFLTHSDLVFKNLRFPYLVEHMEEPQGTPYTLLEAGPLNFFDIFGFPSSQSGIFQLHSREE